MKHDYRMNWTLPALPLGPARPKVLPISDEAKVANSRYMFEEFEWPTAEGVEITDADCKQINGAAQAPRSESVRSDILPSTTPEVAPPFRVGDRVRVVRAAAGVLAHWAAEFMGEYGVITEDGGTPVRVQLSDGYAWWLSRESLELA